MQLLQQVGSVTLKKVIPEHLTPVLHKFEECGCILDIKSDTIKLNAPKKLNNIEIKTMPYPRFPNRYAVCFCKYANNSKRDVNYYRKYI